MWCLPLWLFCKSEKKSSAAFFLCCPCIFIAEHHPYDFRLRFIATAIVYDLYACSARGRCGSTVNAKIDCWSLFAKLISSLTKLPPPPPPIHKHKETPRNRKSYDPNDLRHDEPKKKKPSLVRPTFSKNVVTNVGNKLFTLLSSGFPPQDHQQEHGKTKLQL